MKSVSLFFGLFLLSACSSDIELNEPQPPTEDNPQTEEVVYINIRCPGEASQSGIEEASETIIQDENNFLHYLEISDLDNDLEIPEVNFETETVIALNMGRQRTSGFRIDVSAVSTSGSNTFVSVRKVSPSEGCSVNTAMTYPYCFISIPKTDNNFVFENTEIAECN